MLRKTFVAGTVAAALAARTARVASAQTATLPTIRFTSSPSDDLRPILYAQSAGLFGRAGIAVVINRASSGATVAEAVIGGAMDVGKASMSSLVTAYAQGLPFVLIAPSAIHRKDDPNDGIMVRADSPIRSVLDLQNKVVACTAIGDIGYLGTRALIDAQGGNSALVKWVEVPTATLGAALDAARLDAGLTTEPYLSKDMASGKFRIIVDMLNGYARPMLESAYFSTRDYVTKNRDTVTRFAKALQAGAVYSNTHVAETVPLLVAFTNMDPQAAALMHHTETATTFDPGMIQPVIDLAYKYKIIPKTFSARDML